MLPASTSSRMRFQPSDSTACSPWLSTARVSQGCRRSNSIRSGSPRPAGTAMTERMPGSRTAFQMIRASGAAMSGCSAKVNPPLGWIEVGRVRPSPRAPSHTARPRMPGDIVGIAAQPFPHQPRPVDAAEPHIISDVAPETARRSGPALHDARASIGPRLGRRRSRPAVVPEYIEIIKAARLANRNATGAHSSLLGWIGKLVSA